MSAKRQVKIGTRTSRLATVQAQSVLSELSSMYPGVELELLKITTTGDRRDRDLVGEAGGKGMFVKELESALLQGMIDMAVHSLKDMPTSIPEGLQLAAVTPRMDPRDVYLSSSGGLSDLLSGARVGTSSPRRRVQLLNRYPHIEVCELRGNIDTRVRKVLRGELDGIITASVALLRLGIEHRVSEYLPPDDFTPAVGQGALGLEIRCGDADMSEMVISLNHQPTWDCITAERAFLKALGGGCRIPIAALAKLEGEVLYVNGMVASPDGKHILRASVKESALTPEEAGDQLARKMLDIGARSLIER